MFKEMDGGSLRYYYVLPCGHFLEFSNETLDEFLLTQFTQTFFFWPILLVSAAFIILFSMHPALLSGGIFVNVSDC